MKKILFIGGPMGIGKTAVSERLNQLLDHSIFLDGDWCWNMDPFIVNEENKKMVISNVQHLLQSYIDNAGFEHIVFSWVMDEQEIIDAILDKVEFHHAEFYSISLLASEEKLVSNLSKDIQLGVRDKEVICRSIARLVKYEQVHSDKIDTTNLSIEETAQEIMKLIHR